jgi:tetratricopeptide (TPR) repeat protein
MRFKGLFLSALAVLLSFSALAQDGWNWPTDPEKRFKARENYVLHNDLKKEGEFLKAVKPLSWLLNETPDLNRALYINGIAIYSELAEAESNPAKKKVYADSVLTLWDLRLQYFGEKEIVFERKSLDAYRFFREDASYYGGMINDFQKAIQLKGTQIFETNLVAYMDVLRRQMAAGAEISEDEIMEVYEDVSAIVDAKLSEGRNVERLTTIKEQIDGLVADLIKVDCDYIKNNLGPKYFEDPADLKMAKKIVVFSLQNKCTDTDVFIAAARTVYEQEPDYGIAKFIAIKSKQSGDFDAASKFFAEAAGLTDDQSKKAESFMELGDISMRKNRKAEARAYFLKAVQADPSKRDAFNMIGNMYMNSYEECAGRVSRVNDRALFIAAFEMYKKAGNAQMMAKAKEQFPSAEEIFTENMELGQEITVGCWINETVSLQKR